MARMTRKELTKSANKGWAFEAQMSLLKRYKRDGRAGSYDLMNKGYMNASSSPLSPRQKESTLNITVLTALKQSNPKAFIRKCKSIALLLIL